MINQETNFLSVCLDKLVLSVLGWELNNSVNKNLEQEGDWFDSLELLTVVAFLFLWRTRAGLHLLGLVHDTDFHISLQIYSKLRQRFSLFWEESDC